MRRVDSVALDAKARMDLFLFPYLSLPLSLSLIPQRLHPLFFSPFASGRLTLQR